MLRLTPSSISLSSRDVKDHLAQQAERKSQNDVCIQRKKTPVSTLQDCEEEINTAAQEWRNQLDDRYTEVNLDQSIQAESKVCDVQWFDSDEGDEDFHGDEHNTKDDAPAQLPALPDEKISGFESSRVCGNIRSIIRSLADGMNKNDSAAQMHYSCSSPEHVFNYDGHEQSELRDNSATVLETVSTLEELQDIQRLSHRNVYVRSPFIRSYGYVAAPERRLTFSVDAHMISYGTLGSFWSQPARRPKHIRRHMPNVSVEDQDVANVANANQIQSNKERSTDPYESAFRSLVHLPIRLAAADRSRSPIITQSTSYSPTCSLDQTRISYFSTPFQAGSAYRSRTETPQSRLHVYSDQIPASVQPQTPQQLPEARHRSRFHPSYTAPAFQRFETPTTSHSRRSRNRGTRSDSPTGMETPGFQGLYGGQENADDESMFDRAARRLVMLQEARRSGSSTTNTPDREMSFTDVRGEYR